jgi:hypothetical protein
MPEEISRSSYVVSDEIVELLKNGSISYFRRRMNDRAISLIK